MPPMNQNHTAVGATRRTTGGTANDREASELRNNLLYDGPEHRSKIPTGARQHTASGPTNILLLGCVWDERGHLRVARPDRMDLCSHSAIHVVPTPTEPLAPPQAESQIQSKTQKKRPTTRVETQVTLQRATGPLRVHYTQEEPTNSRHLS